MRLGDRRERRLIRLLCSTADTRRARLGEILSLSHEVDVARLLALLKRTRLVVLVGGRLLALGGHDIPELECEFTPFSAHARRWGAAIELASLEILDRLTAAGIRALPLKGSLLARELYGDVGARTSVDVDVLVAPENLHDAVGVLSGLGWHWQKTSRRVDGLPALHETLVHSTLPRVELHWRVHWYERQFAADALARAQQPPSGTTLEMQPLDGLIALMLFYARDGFAGLRFPADVATWWDIRCAGTGGPSPSDFVAERYPALAAPVNTAANVLADLVGVPLDHVGELPLRWRVAGGLASPFLDGGRHQAEANAGLADLLLAPPGASSDAMRRVLNNAPTASTRTPGTMTGDSRTTAGHVLRVARRWALALVPALLRGSPPLSRAGLTQRGQPRVPLPAHVGDPGDGVRQRLRSHAVTYVASLSPAL